MKMTKKIMLGVVAAAAILMTGCQKEVGEIDWKGGTKVEGVKTFTVSQENEADATIRGMKRVGTFDRVAGTCVVSQTEVGTTGWNGQTGFIAGLVENEDKSFNFLVTGVRVNNGKPETYVSYYCNITKADLEDKEHKSKNFGAYADGKDVTKTAFDASVTTPYEIPLLAFPTALPTDMVKDGVLTATIQIAENTDGGFIVTWYKDAVVAEGAIDRLDYTQMTPVTVAGKMPLIVAGEKVGRTAASKKGDLYVYANIQSGKTLNGSWKLYDCLTKADAACADDMDVIGDIIFN